MGILRWSIVKGGIGGEVEVRGLIIKIGPNRMEWN